MRRDPVDAEDRPMTTTRDEVTLVLAEIMTKDLPKGVVEADRCAKLAKICLMHGIMNGPEEWDSIWSDVMDVTGCGTWNEVMNKGKY